PETRAPAAPAVRGLRGAEQAARASHATAADAARAVGVAVGARDLHPAGAPAGAGARVLRAAGHAPERAHAQHRPAPGPDPRPLLSPARRLGRRREPLRGAAGRGRRARHRAGALSLDAAERREVLGKLQQRNKAFVWIQRKVDPGTAHRVRELSLEGIGFLTEHRRYYPQRELAAHVLGYVGLDNDGMSGVEHAFEKEIRGRAAKVVVHTDARRRPLAQTERPSTDGA